MNILHTRFHATRFEKEYTIFGATHFKNDKIILLIIRATF